jgi:uncharacterized protein
VAYAPHVHRVTVLLLSSSLALGCNKSASPDPGAAVEAPPTPTDSPEAPPTPPPIAATDVELPLHASGAIELPGGMTLQYFAKVERGDDGLRGELSIPEQGANDVPLSKLALEGSTLSFELAEVGATWTVGFGDDGVACSFAQRGMKLSCSLERIDEAAYAQRGKVERPQNPQPPFPYDVVEVEYENAEAGVKLAGTLTVPEGGPHPVALLLSGSGAQDRDETVAGHKPFWVLADHLARHGIAVLRVDDRGVGGSTGNAAEATMEDFAADAEAGVAFLATHDRIDASKIGLIGHSEGGAVAPYVAARNPKVAFVVMLAGPGVTGGELLVEQVGALMQSMGGDESTVEQAKAAQRQAMEILQSTPDDAAAREKLKALMDPEDAGGDAMAAQLDVVVSPWFRTFVSYDPAPTLKKLKIPVLAVNGSLDTQVVAAQNAAAIEKALAKNPKAKVVTLEGLNHLFQQATTGSPMEYERIDQTLDPALLDLVTTWLRDAV